MKTNRVLEKLKKDEAVCMACPTPYVSPKLIEMIGLIGFDGIWIDMEHQDYSFDQVFNSIPVGSPDAAQSYYDKGARFFVCGAAIVLLQQGYSKIWNEFASIFRSG